MKSKEVYREVQKVDGDGTKFYVVGTVTKFGQHTGYGKIDRYAVMVQWYEDEDFGDSEMVSNDELMQDDASLSDAVRRCIYLIDSQAYRLIGVKSAETTTPAADNLPF